MISFYISSSYLRHALALWKYTIFILEVPDSNPDNWTCDLDWNIRGLPQIPHTDKYSSWNSPLFYNQSINQSAKSGLYLAHGVSAEVTSAYSRLSCYSFYKISHHWNRKGWCSGNAIEGLLYFGSTWLEFHTGHRLPSDFRSLKVNILIISSNLLQPPLSKSCLTPHSRWSLFTWHYRAIYFKHGRYKPNN